MGRQKAQTRRRAPGKRFIGETAEQSEAARQAERERVQQLAQAAEAARLAETPVTTILGELVQSAARLVGTIATAPFRLALALRQPRTA
jgi:hypothetical protein